MKKGKVYGVGVGPGDPELMTIKAVRIINENNNIIVPGKSVEGSVAYKIAKQVVTDIDKKNIIAINMPMINDEKLLNDKHRENAKIIEEYLDRGENIVYLTLGDVTIYCSFIYLQQILMEDGYETELVNGITSFCAAAGRLNSSLVEKDKELVIIPSFYKTDFVFENNKNYILMKSAGHISEVKEKLRNCKRKIVAVENCGMENEKIYNSLDEIPDTAGYYLLIIVKD